MEEQNLRRKEMVKGIIVFVLVLSSFYPIISSAVITDGADAIDALGHYDDNYSNPNPVYTKSDENDGINRFGFDFQEVGIVMDHVNHRLFVSNTQGGSRVLVYNLNTDDTLIDRVPDNVLGQPNFYTNTEATTQSGMKRPYGLAYDSTRQYLFVADSLNSRVLVFDVSSITDGENAINVLGQPDFTSSATATTQSGMNGPAGLAYDSTNQRLFVAEASNNRVLVFNVSTITDGEDAVNVLGQANFTSSSSATTQSGLNSPQGGIDYDSVNQLLFVPDTNNHRVVVYNVSSITNGEDAVNVLGQANFTSSSAATTQSGMYGPYDVAVDTAHNRLFVLEVTNKRITVFDTTAITDGEDAVNVLQQPDFTTAAINITQSGTSDNSAIFYDSVNNRIYNGQSNPHRILIFDVESITNGENAIDGLGQFDDSITSPSPIYTKSGAYNGPNKFGFDDPQFGIVLDSSGDRLFVSDTSNKRVLVYNLNADDTLIDRIPDYVLGQSNFYTNTAATTQSGMSSPVGLAYDSTNKRLFVADSVIHRVLIFDVSSITNGENAVNVLGQADFTSSGSNATQAGLSTPLGLAYDDTNSRLFVAQQGANRVTVFNVSSITNGENAVNVLGQPDFTTSSAGTTQSKMNLPRGIAYDSTNQRLFVVNSTANRVTVYNVSSITDGDNAAKILGQTDFTTATGGVTQSKMSTPRGVAYDSTNQRLFVSQSGGRRVTVYDVESITDGEDAVNVLGQANFTSSTAAATQSGMNSPNALWYDSRNNRLYVGDLLYNRITVFAVAPTTVTVSGTVYSDEGTTALGSKTVAISINGAAAASSTTSNASTGAYSISGVSVNAGDILTLYIDGETEKGVTVTAGTGSNMTGIDIYQDRLITRHDNYGGLSNSNLNTADNNGDSDISSIYSINSGTLEVASGKHLFIPSGHTFAPGGNISLGGNFTNNGTFTAATNTVIFNGTSQTIAGSTTFYSLTKQVTTADTLTFTAGTTQTISVGGILRLSGASGQLLNLRSSTSGTRWNITLNGNSSVEYVNVQDSSAYSGRAVTAANSVDDGNNVNWDFTTPNSAPSPGQVVSGGNQELANIIKEGISQIQERLLGLTRPKQGEQEEKPAEVVAPPKKEQFPSQEKQEIPSVSEEEQEQEPQPQLEEKTTDVKTEKKSWWRAFINWVIKLFR